MVKEFWALGRRGRTEETEQTRAVEEQPDQASKMMAGCDSP